MNVILVTSPSVPRNWGSCDGQIYVTQRYAPLRMCRVGSCDKCVRHSFMCYGGQQQLAATVPLPQSLHSVETVLRHRFSLMGILCWGTGNTRYLSFYCITYICCLMLGIGKIPHWNPPQSQVDSWQIKTQENFLIWKPTLWRLELLNHCPRVRRGSRSRRPRSHLVPI